MVAVLLGARAVAVASRARTRSCSGAATDVWAMAPDGTGQRAVTHGERSYEWPSMADDGTILAPDTTGWLHRLTPAGGEIGAPIPTAAAVATEDTPAEPPTHVRISPDGSRIAYDEAIDGDVTTLWWPGEPNQSLGQQGLVAPSWIGNDRLLLSRDISAPARGDVRAVHGRWRRQQRRAAVQRPGRRVGDGLRRRGFTLGPPDRGARGRRRGGGRHAAPRRAPALPGSRSSSARSRSRRPTRTARRARRSRPTGRAWPGRRATASTSPQSSARRAGRDAAGRVGAALERVFASGRGAGRSSHAGASGAGARAPCHRAGDRERADLRPADGPGRRVGGSSRRGGSGTRARGPCIFGRSGRSGSSCGSAPRVRSACRGL